MKHLLNPRVTTYLLIWTLLCSTMAFGQTAGKTEPAKAAAPAATDAIWPPDFLLEVTGSASSDQTYKNEAQAITRILSSADLKNPVFIDDHGYARDLVLEAVAARL